MGPSPFENKSVRLQIANKQYDCIADQQNSQLNAFWDTFPLPTEEVLNDICQARTKPLSRISSKRQWQRGRLILITIEFEHAEAEEPIS